MKDELSSANGCLLFTRHRTNTNTERQTREKPREMQAKVSSSHEPTLAGLRQYHAETLVDVVLVRVGATAAFLFLMTRNNQLSDIKVSAELSTNFRHVFKIDR
ncbi:hypothetical protein F2P81_020553 [Scophthalmus maximus]|uniref:Uncharacterized protein n=1 Tax=Scophthalmus maximus TaxID=52904 RepID=A0A6A4SAK7_SCOMX|nr:hypothetical protein F2P81_020553 [Scophthalmus maximus]